MHCQNQMSSGRMKRPHLIQLERQDLLLRLTDLEEVGRAAFLLGLGALCKA
jgi:hypothetical protein